MGKATLGWIAGCLTIWMSLFAIGNFLYGRTSLALIQTAVFLVSGLTLLYVVNTLWDRAPDQTSRARV
jgi:SSS family solute:Na+ symporter